MIVRVDDLPSQNNATNTLIDTTHSKRSSAVEGGLHGEEVDRNSSYSVRREANPSSFRKATGEARSRFAVTGSHMLQVFLFN